MSGGGGSTQTTSNAPPQQFLDAYSNVLGRAQNVASTPYQNYPGQLQAGFSPMQQQGFNVVGSSPGVQAPYLNAAAQDFSNATAPVGQTMQPYVNQAQQQYQNAAGADLQGALTPFQQQAQQGFAAGSQTLTPQQYSGAAIQGFESPYTQQVVNATQAQFNQQNRQAANQLQGNAASQGALGGDRVGVAQGVLAGQQQMAQAPVIAGLENQGFAQAQQEFNTQQQTNLTAQQQSAALKQQAAQGYAGLGGQSLTAAQQQAALQAQAGQGFAQLGQSELGAAQAQGWLSAQSGAGMAGLGNQALSGTLASGNALLGAGAQQQQQAQTGLNIPYQQYLAQLSYPFQTTGWLSNIAQGAGAGAGGTGSTTTPGASIGSQIAGAGLGAAGLVGATGGYGSNGYLSNLFSSGNGIGVNAAAYSAPIGPTISGGFDAAAALGNRGGSVSSIGGFANGGGVPDVSVNGVNVGQAPGSQSVIAGGFGVPDVSTSVVPASGASGATPLLKRSFPTTTTTGPPQDSTIGSLLKTAGSIAANVYGGPAGGAAANALGSQVHFNRGGLVPNGAGGFARAPGGSVPVLPRGFAAGGAPAISVTTIPDARGVGVPTMTVDPSVIGSGGGSTASGSPTDQMNTYLAQQAAGAFHPPATPPPAPAPAASTGSNGLTADQVSQLQGFLAQQQQAQEMSANASAGNGGPMRRGGTIRGFDEGGGIAAPAAAYDPNMFSPDQFIPAAANVPASTAPALPNTGSDADLAVPLVPPGTPGRPSSGSGHRGFGHPPAPPPGNGPLPSPPIPLDQQANAPAGATGQKPPASSSAWIDSLMSTRAHKEDHANPWLALATAGFGMAAGNSPHALQNLGAGAIEGIRQYTSSDQAAKALAAKVDETRAQLATAQAYHEATIDARRYGIDTRADTAASNRDNAMAMAMARIGASSAAAENRAAAAADNGRWSYVGTDPATNLPILLNGRTGEQKFGQAPMGMKVSDQGRADAAQQRIQATAQYRAWQENHGDATLEQRDRASAAAIAAGATREDIQLLNGSKDIMGKPQLTPTTAHQAGTTLRQANTPGAGSGAGVTLPPAQTDAPQIGEIRRGYSFQGGDPADPASWQKAAP